MICVTGAGGTVGSELIKQLESAHVPFRAAFFSVEKAEVYARAGSMLLSLTTTARRRFVRRFRDVTNCFFWGRTCRPRRSSNSMRSKRHSGSGYGTL